MKLLLSLILISVFISQEKPNVLGETFTFKSKKDNKEHSIIVKTPLSYNEQNKKFPVLYVLDGSVYFPLAVSVSNMLGQFNLKFVPEFIIVSIQS